MKLLLISLQSNAYVTGLKYIASNARAECHDVRILFLPGYLEKELDPEIKGFINEYNPDLIGISLMSIEYYPAKNLTLLIKKMIDIPIVWGGVHAIIQPDECIQYADFVCTGEGEEAVVRLLEHLGKDGVRTAPDIPGIWVNHKGEIIKYPDAEPVGNLDVLPQQEYLPEYFYGLHENRIYNLILPRMKRYSVTMPFMVEHATCLYQQGAVPSSAPIVEIQRLSRSTGKRSGKGQLIM
jgi:radical SAM superfamily enzyme YgiQ (UPF0313 family)